MGRGPQGAGALGPQTLLPSGRGTARGGPEQGPRVIDAHLYSDTPCNPFSIRQPMGYFKNQSKEISRITLHSLALNPLMVPYCSQSKCKIPHVWPMRPQGPTPASLPICFSPCSPDSPPHHAGPPSDLDWQCCSTHRPWHRLFPRPVMLFPPNLA